MAPLDWLFYRQGFTGRTVAKKTVVPDIFLSPLSTFRTVTTLGYNYYRNPLAFCFFLPNYGFCYLNLTGITKFKYRRKKNELWC